MPRHKPIDELPCYAQLPGDLRQAMRFVPAGLDDFLSVNPDFSRCILRRESDHKAIGKGPRLTSEVCNILDQDSGLFLNLAMHGLFKAFSGFDKTCEDAEK